MKEARYDWQWPRDGLYMDCFVHEIMNYRYHWHQDQYELNVLLHGSQEFCVDRSNVLLQEDDVILIPPGCGHASYGQQANTRALVLHFSASAFRPFVKKGERYLFPDCVSSAQNCHDPRFRQIRFLVSQIFEAGYRQSPYSQLRAKASLELLLATLCESFHPQTVQITQEDAFHQETFSRMIQYIEKHYSEKISLEDLAAFSQYNRTYVSTLFKNTVGVNFHEYLTRVRFQKALYELATQKKTLTDIALDNGFPDLKSFNRIFRESTGRSPSEYRAQLSPDRIMPDNHSRRYVPLDDPLIQRKLAEYDTI